MYAGSRQLNTGAHPRSRGEHVSGLGVTIISLGSSPLARGTPKLRESISAAPGLIPARAGNTYKPVKTSSL